MKYLILALFLLAACADEGVRAPELEPDGSVSTVTADAAVAPDSATPPDAELPDAAPTCRPPGVGVLVGDSIVYSLFANSKDVMAASSDKIGSIAVPGNTIAQQRAAWLASPYAGDPKVTWVFVQVGVNDLRTGRTPEQMLVDYHALSDTIAESNPGALVIWGLMLPAHSNQDFSGPAYPRWVAANAELTSEFAAEGDASFAMNDGQDALRHEYDGGDGLHPNVVGNKFNATWALAFVQRELLPVCP